MPLYSFSCKECGNKDDKILSIKKFFKIKENPEDCSKCKKGKMLAKLAPAYAKIEKRKEDIVEEIEEEVRDIVKKVKEGDLKTIQDVYGDRPNPQKQ